MRNKLLSGGAFFMSRSVESCDWEDLIRQGMTLFSANVEKLFAANQSFSGGKTHYVWLMQSKIIVTKHKFVAFIRPVSMVQKRLPLPVVIFFNALFPIIIPFY